MIDALFLDRDGVINIDFGYVHLQKQFIFIPGIFDFCHYFINNNFKIFIVTNQSGIERGYFSDQQFRILTKYMLSEFEKNKILISEVVYCPFLKSNNRKPNPGMFNYLITKYNINCNKSFSIGDKPRDIIASKNAGINNAFLFNNNFTELLSKINK